MADKKISELTALTTPDGTEELVVNDSGVSKKITQANLFKLGDNVKAKFGASDDLQIYHDGSNSQIRDAGTGKLLIYANGGVNIEDQNGSGNMAVFNSGSDVSLYHNGSPKLATTSTGIDVTGSVTCDGFTSTGIDDNATSNQLTVSDAAVTIGTSFTLGSTGTEGGHINFQDKNNSTAWSQDIDADGHMRLYTTSATSTNVSIGQLAINTGNVGLYTNGSIRMRVAADGNVIFTQSIVPTFKTSFDTSGNTISIAASGTYDFNQSSGMYLVNNHYSGGVAIFLCGGGSVSTVGSAGTTFGSMAYNSSISGYTWTSNHTLTANYTFTHIRTRPAA